MGPRSFKRGNVPTTYNMAATTDASMGPRSFKRGNCGRWRKIFRRRSSLQWGHVLSNVETTCRPGIFCGPVRRFNGATFFQTWKRLLAEIDRPNAQKLQWGHVLSNVETRPRVSRPSTRRSASMGPRSFKRGNALRILTESDCVKLLQWGHVLSNVET